MPPPPGDGVGVVVGVAHTDRWLARLETAKALLADDELGRASRMRRAEHASARVLAYALHRLFLGALLRMDAREVPLVRDGNGCPWVDGHPLRTSLSHADGAVAFAASGAGPVGIDIERLDRAADIADIAEEVCHPSELAALAGLPQAARSGSLLQTWVRKEAYLKAAGVGLARGMPGFAAAEGAVLPLWPDAGEAAGSVEVGLVQALPGHVLALAATPGHRPRVVVLEPA